MQCSAVSTYMKVLSEQHIVEGEGRLLWGILGFERYENSYSDISIEARELCFGGSYREGWIELSVLKPGWKAPERVADVEGGSYAYWGCVCCGAAGVGSILDNCPCHHAY